MDTVTTEAKRKTHELSDDDLRALLKRTGVAQTVPTNQAAAMTNTKPQTWRRWACKGGPIKPLRVGGRLAWPVAEINKMLGAS
jgi:hypothetical protein